MTTNNLLHCNSAQSAPCINFVFICIPHRGRREPSVTCATTSALGSVLCAWRITASPACRRALREALAGVVVTRRSHTDHLCYPRSRNAVVNSATFGSEGDDGKKTSG